MKYGVLDNLIDNTITREAISVQKDVTIVSTLTGYFEEIIEVIRSNNITKGKVSRNRSIRIAMAKIDNAIKDRFGITVKTVESDNTILSVQTTPPKALNVLAGNVNTSYNQIKDSINYIQGKDSDSDIHSDDIDTQSYKWVDIMKMYLKSVDEVSRAVGANEITVDLVNAKIYGYPDKAAVIILINPIKLFVDIGLSSSEVSASYLHEVGHAFTHIEYSYRAIRNTTTLIDSVIAEVGRNKKPLDAIKLSYIATFGDDSISKTTTIPSAVTVVVNNYIKQANEMGGSAYGNKDSERLADQFVNRLGGGESLATALGALYEHGYKSDIRELKDLGVTTAWLFTLSAVIGAFTPALGMIAAAATGIAILGIVMSIIVGMLIFIIIDIISAFLDRGIDKGNPYDAPERRLKRIRNDLVRQLRTTDMSKDTIKALLGSIDVIESISKHADKERQDIIYRTVGKMFDYNKKQTSIADIDDYIEDLMNNELHIAANKLKTLE